MKIIRTIKDFEAYRAKINNGDLGFVATMGALHLGHISLVKQSIQENSQTIVSIFVNPTQFDKANDLNNYPNILDQDLKKLELAGANAIFIPSYLEIYPDNYSFQVIENQLSTQYCGAHRNGHFNGVLTVVMKLLNIIKPTKAYFGEKDYQQLTLINKMVEAFFISTQIVACPIIREKDGLAMSSRNLRLNPKQRKLAAQLYKTISLDVSINEIHNKLSSLGFDVDYIETLDNRLLVAAYIDEIRLIDNIGLKHIKEKVA